MNKKIISLTLLATIGMASLFSNTAFAATTKLQTNDKIKNYSITYEPADSYVLDIPVPLIEQSYSTKHITGPHSWAATCATTLNYFYFTPGNPHISVEAVLGVYKSRINDEYHSRVWPSEEVFTAFNIGYQNHRGVSYDFIKNELANKRPVLAKMVGQKSEVVSNKHGNEVTRNVSHTRDILIRGITYYPQTSTYIIFYYDGREGYQGVVLNGAFNWNFTIDASDGIKYECKEITTFNR